MAPGGVYNGHRTVVTYMTQMLPLCFICFLLLVVHTESVPLRQRRASSIHNDLYYIRGNIRCLRCPAGTYVEKDCTRPDTEPDCRSCQAGVTYSEGPSGLNHCLTCTSCRDDQEEMSACTPDKNSICHCKEGTYCPTDHPCEICLPCTSSCPPGQVFQMPCNSTSDGQCAPTGGNYKLWLIIGIAVLVIFIAVFCIWKQKDRMKWLQLCPAGEDNGIPLLSTTLHFPDNTNRDDQDTIIRKAFYIFAVNVPNLKWLQFVRHLGLTENEIMDAQSINPNNVTEQHYDMLAKWREHKACNDVNTLLKHLDYLNMRQAASTIKEKLLHDNLYVEHPYSS
ncbi:tumor necrosis factor receptor superfamily member 6-like isoform 2-T2 [Discoglossus pictus]